MFILNNVSSTVLQKGQDTPGMGSWAYITIVEKNYKNNNLYHVPTM